MALDTARAEERRCPICGQTEDHENDPRHGILGGPDYHMDCHAQVGCDLCRLHLAEHEDSVKGKAPVLAAFPIPGSQEPDWSARFEHVPDVANIVRFKRDGG